MIFIALCIHLKHSCDKVFSVEDGADAHGSFLKAITIRNSKLGQMIHDLKRNKRFTLGFVSSSEGYSILRITFWGEEGIQLLNTLGTILNRQPEMLIGSTRCFINRIDFYDSEWCGTATWNTFQEHGKKVSKVHFEFITPMAIRKEGSQKNIRITHTLPDQGSIFLGLQRRWNYMGGPAFPDGVEEFIKKGHCRVSYFDIRTVDFKADGYPQIGCIGRISYRLDKDHIIAPVFGALTLFSAYVSVGYQTARGMGLVKVGIEE